MEHENLNNQESAQLGIGAVSGSFLFDKALLEKVTIKQPEYVMGVDTYDKGALAYCLGRKVDGVFEIILTKTMRDEKEFKQEVENLAKYFNADVFWSGDSNHHHLKVVALDLRFLVKLPTNVR